MRSLEFLLTLRILCLACLSGLLLSPNPISAQTIPAARAKDFVGQEKTVSGTVMKAGPVGKLFIIDIDGVYPNSPFQAVIFGDKLPGFDQSVLAGYKDKAVEISGKITEHKGRPQIILNAPSQIVIAGSAAAPAESGSPAPAPALSTPDSAPSNAPAPADPKKNLLANGNFNKGKKAWDLPPGAEVVTEDSSEVLKVKLNPSGRVYLKQSIDKLPKGSMHFEVSFDAKLADGSSLNDGVTVRIGQSAKDSSNRKFRNFKAGWQTLKWPRSGDLASTEDLVFSLEFDSGEGSILVDNIQLLPLP